MVRAAEMLDVAGEAVGVVNESAMGALIAWAVGASAAWMIAPRVAAEGWGVGVCSMLACLLGAFVLLMSVELAVGGVTPGANPFTPIAFLSAFAAVASLLWNPRPLVNALAALNALGDTDLRDVLRAITGSKRCPQCRQHELYRRSEGGVGCYCGYRAASAR